MTLVLYVVVLLAHVFHTAILVGLVGYSNTGNALITFCTITIAISAGELIRNDILPTLSELFAKCLHECACLSYCSLCLRLDDHVSVQDRPLLALVVGT